jgi:hypothetical protein
MNIGDWLLSLGLERYAQAFLEHDIDAEVLPSLTTEDLIGLGVISIGHRRKLLDAIATLRSGALGGPFARTDFQSVRGEEPCPQGCGGGVSRQKLR